MDPFMLASTEARLPHARWHKVPLESVRLTGGFWANRQDTNRRVTLRHGYKMLEQVGTLDNFRVAAGLKQGPYRGQAVFLDSDVYKWLEAVAYELQANPDPALRQQADEVIDLVAAAQASDGYLNTYYQLVEPDHRWNDLDFGHELYCAGHLFEAAAAYTRATRTTVLLDVATRFADLIDSIFGPGKRPGAPGHPEIELALVKLYRVTNNPAYLNLAKYFVDQRGKGVMRGWGWLKAEYHQDRVPVREQDIIEGHAVRAMYLNAGVTDLFLESGEEALLNAMQLQWRDMSTGKVFVTGGVGSQYEGEAFGDPYELPPDQCYCETCAAIGSIFWNWRMLQVTGESRFADSIERALYNGVLSGIALDGESFFYMNPLLSRGGYGRHPWHVVACCPPNLMRLFSSLPQYFVSHDDSGIQVHLYGTASVSLVLGSGQPLSLSMETDYPWDGHVTFKLEDTDGSTWQLRLREPGWCRDVSVSVNGEAVQTMENDAGYLVLERAWRPGDVVELDMRMEPHFVAPHPRIDAVRGSLAIQRGPLVYCVEGADHPGVNLLDIRIDENAPLHAVWRDDGLAGGVMVIQAPGTVADVCDWGDALYRRADELEATPLEPVQLTAIPYFAWANRGANPMRVWIPRQDR